MEIVAASEALHALDGPVTVVSDSTYVVHCFNNKWYVGWKARGWKNSKKEDVANQDLWRPLIDHVLERGDVTWQWVKGHSGDEWNDVADRLAVEAAMRQEGRTGDRPPEVLGVADAVGLAAGAPPETPAAPRLPSSRSTARTATWWWCSATARPSSVATTPTSCRRRCSVAWATS